MTCSRCDESDPMSYADGYAEGRVEADSLATQLEQMRRERDDANADRDAMAQELGDTRADLAEARATNARLHRRAQGVDARKPEDEETIRRLRAEVVATAKHAGYVAGHVFRLRRALSDAQHAQSMAVRERDEARATIDAAWNATGVAGAVRGLTTLDDVVQCHRHDLMEARAKLARIRRALVRIGSVTPGGTMTAMDALRALRDLGDEDASRVLGERGW